MNEENEISDAREPGDAREGLVFAPVDTMVIGGLVQAQSLDKVIRDEERKMAEMTNNQPMIQGLAGHIKQCWQEAKKAKEENVQKRMLQSLRQRNGEYDPDDMNRILSQNEPAIYMLVTSNKCRAAAAWLREALGGMPWKAAPTPVSDVDDQTKAGIVEGTQWLIQQSILAGYRPSQDEVKGFMMAMRDSAFAKIQEEAKARAERMTEKMKDQLIEGGFEDAMDDFIDDLVTFPAAILKGPVVYKERALKWTVGQNGTYTPDVQEIFKLKWERVSPLDLYPAPDASGVDDGYLIERHKLSRQDLNDMKGVEGYNDAAIDAVLDQYGQQGLMNMLPNDTERADAEGKPTTAVTNNPSKTIDAYQFWGSVQGKMLKDWGLPAEQIEDELAEYHIEAWLIGDWVIKAMINPDPLHRKPYYKTSWENCPGSFWGKSIPDLCRDAQRMCNFAARSLAYNVSIASGPQVAYDVSRLPKGEVLSEMHPWKIWQFKDNPNGSSSQPISFFQPTSNAQELMAIYEKFSVQADEQTGIPRYMTGDSNVGGAGRTASGMSMLMTNAGKSIKSVVASVDRILQPAIERLYMYNMMYLDDPELKGDVNIVVEGAEALVRQQQQQQRLNEFLALTTTNPVINQLVGPEGIAYILREVAKNLGVDTDRIIPALPILRARMQAQQTQMAMAQAQQAEMQAQANGQSAAGGTPKKPENMMDKRRLMDGTAQSVAKAGR